MCTCACTPPAVAAKRSAKQRCTTLVLLQLSTPTHMQNVQPWFPLSTASIEHQQPPINCIQHDTMTCSGLPQQHLPGVAQRNAQMWREHLATNPYKPPNTQRLTASDSMAATQAHAYTCSSCDPGTLTVGCPCLPGSQPTSQTKAQVQATLSRPLWPVNNLTNDTMHEQQLSATHQKGNCRTPGTMPWA